MNIAIIGYGKMGKEIESIAIERNHNVKLVIDKHNYFDFSYENLKDIDVAIEFSTPDSAFDNYIKCFEANIPVVSGTTGWLDKIDIIKENCTKENNTFFYASNFSLGVNIVFELNKKLAEMMNGIVEYDVDIEEIHHTEKLDAPSGTAISLANDIIDNVDRKEKWVKEHYEKESDLVIKSLRKVKVPGTHTIKYDSDVDTITLEHRAKSRKGFALGAILAAEFIQSKKGFFTMKDMLNFK